MKIHIPGQYKCVECKKGFKTHMGATRHESEFHKGEKTIIGRKMGGERCDDSCPCRRIK